MIQGMNWYGNEIYDEIVLTGCGGRAVWESRGLRDELNGIDI